jgi:glycosyltransferase involved in cell wall biosynthesis
MSELMSGYDLDLISVVIPLLNEGESLPELVSRVFTACDSTSMNCEIIAINDGSTDNSQQVLIDLRAKDPRLKIISFRRNFGKSDALDAGFRAARGRYIITMDADLQDDPKEIPRFIEMINNEWDLVSGWKKKRHDPVLSKNIPSRLFNRATSFFSGVRLHDFNCGFKCYRAEVIQSLHVYGEMHRFLPAIAYMKGFRVSEMVVEHHARAFGVSKFGAARFINGMLDLVTVVFTNRYLRKPLHFFGPPGLILVCAGLMIDLWLSFEKIVLNLPLSNRPLLFLGILLIIVGMQLFSIGLIGEMITRNQKNPEYQIREKIGL